MTSQNPVIPRATYRVQMHSQFGFDATAEISDYLAELGVSHVYSSPYLQAAKGSTHGYDVLNHSRANKELGGEKGHAHFCETIGKNGLGQVLDIVPNHMSIAGGHNDWWWDVLENGPASRYAAFFDVDWHPVEEKLHNTVLLPVLGDHYGRVLEAGEIQLKRRGVEFTIEYFDNRYPVAPRSLDDVLTGAAERCESDLLRFLAEGFHRLPLSTATDRASVARRHGDKELLLQLLDRLCREERAVGEAIDEVIAEINSAPDELDVLLDRQNYRLAFWRTAGQELDYRRFFDINTLISLRMEDDRVFAETHVKVLEWLSEGVLDGLRIDHPDGLRDPEQYFERLRQAAPRTWLVAEKILEPGEQMPAQWAVAGTTGYDFLNRLAAIYIDQSSEDVLTQFYGEFTGQPTSYQAVAYEKKHLVLRELFGSDIHRLTTLLANVCERQRRYRDYTRRELNAMLRETIACFPVYRTYVRADLGQVLESDERYVNEAIDAAKANRPELDAQLFDFLRDLLLLRVRGEVEGELVMRFQQTTGPVMAKGVEDTTFYNYYRFTALNEVGGDPGHFGMSLDEFHAACQATVGRWGHSMLASTTHDTKRSEDVRARLAVLSEIPSEWIDEVRSWSEINARHKTGDFPDRNAEYLLYQTLVGAWPIEEPRILAYMEKAIREAKAFTSWTNANAEYEDAVKSFVEMILRDEQFVSRLDRFVTRVLEPGRITSLSQTIIRLTAPGVPDIYQGTELWALSLVDPDNRRPVDFELRRKLLNELKSATPEEIMKRMDEGLPKMWVIRQVLKTRAERHETYLNGGYEPLRANGNKADHVVAFLRREDAITVAPRLVTGVSSGWQDTSLSIPDGSWRNELTGDQIRGGEIQVGDLLRRFPVALLVKTG